MKVKNHHLIGSSILAISLALVTGSVVLPTQASDETAPTSTVFSALYEVAHLEASAGLNSESVIGFLPGTTGYFAYTTNDSGVELWTAEDDTALTWTKSDTNPLAEYNCQRVGRHTMIVFNDATYFAAGCEAGNFILRQTGLTTAEIVHTNIVSEVNVAVDDPSQDPPPADNNPSNSMGGYPTAGIVGTGDNKQLVMFSNNVVSMSTDGDNWIDYATSLNNTLPGQPTGVPLEASQADAAGVIYLAFTSGEVMSFNGEEFISIGEGYLEDVSEGQGMNLPAVALFNDTVYVGNQDDINGASIFAYNLTAETPAWEEIVQLDPEDMIVNKMGLSQFFGDARQYLVFYTSNGDVGTRVMALNTDGELQQLLPDGLGGDENEREVVSVSNKTIVDNGTKKKVLLFGTQNTEDQSRIYVMQLDENMPVDPSTETTIVSAPDTTLSSIFTKTKNTTAFGESFKLKVSNKSIATGDRLTLYVNGKAVNQLKVKNVANTIMIYKGASKLKAGTIFRVSIGRRPAYGSGDEQQLSDNVVTSSAMRVKVVK